MALANAVQGARRPSQQITWTRADGQPEVLSGATITGFIRPVRTGVTRAIAGALSIVDAEHGVFLWEYHTADVVEAGDFEVQFSAAFGAEPSPAKTLTERWRVHERLAVAG